MFAEIGQAEAKAWKTAGPSLEAPEKDEDTFTHSMGTGLKASLLG